MERRPPRGPAEGRPRSRDSGPAASLSLQETQQTESAETPATAHPPMRPLTDEAVDTLWFFLPVDAQEVDGDAGEHDDQAHATDNGFRVETEAQQHSPEHQVAHGHQQVHLEARWGM